MKTKFKITSYRNGKAYARYFRDFKAAERAAGRIFRRTGVVVGIDVLIPREKKA